MSATEQYQWTIAAYEERGNLWLKWETNSPFRAQQGQLHVYNNSSFPNNPQDDTKAWFWDTNSPTNTWDTGLPWGTGWYCAWIAEKPANGPYTYVVQTITDGSMGPNVARA